MREKADVLTIEEKIARLRLPGLLKAIASAENRALVAKARGKVDGAQAGAEEVRILRAELARVLGQEEETGDDAAELAVQDLAARQAAEDRARRAEEEVDRLRAATARAVGEAAALQEQLERAQSRAEEQAGPRPGADVIDDAAVALRGLSLEEIREAMRRAMPAPPPRRTAGARRAPRQPTLAMLDRRPLRQKTEACHG